MTQAFAFLLPEATTPPSLAAINFVKLEIQLFPFTAYLKFVTRLKSQAILRLRACHCKSPSRIV